MENAAHFGSLTPRMQAFREEVLDEQPFVDAERAVLCTESYRQTLAQPPVMRRAMSLAHILDNMTIYIEDKTLLAGNQATKNCNAPVFPEYTMGFILDELDKFELRDGDVFHVTEEDKARIRELAPFWQGKTLREKGGAILPEEVSVFMETGVFGMEGKLNAGDAHLAINHERLLREGLRGYYQRTLDAKAALDRACADLKEGKVQALVTAPLNKEALNGGHTEYLEKLFGGNSLMMLCSGNLRVALVCNHVAIADIPAQITEERILAKLTLLNDSLKRDFGMEKPRIAVLALNPHAGDAGLLGKEEQEIIAPAVQKANEQGIWAFGPYASDGFFGSGHFAE